MKISQRISMSIILILLVFFLLSSLAFSTIASRVYLDEARADLRKEVTYLINDQLLISRVLAGERRPLARDPAELTFLMDSNLILVSKDNEMRYSEDDDEAALVLNAIEEDLELDDYIFVYRQVEQKNFAGTIVMYYRIEEIRQALNMNRRAGLYGLLMALPLTTLLAWYMQKKISGPIQDLKEDMAAYAKGKGMHQPLTVESDEVVVLTETFEALRDTIEENEQNREMLFSNISHELKTPLMTIRGYAEGIQEGVIRSESGLETIIEETERLNAFAQKVLTLSKLSTQPFEKERVKLQLLLEGTTQRYRPMAEQKDLVLDLLEVEDVDLELDEERYRQAIGNLFANALRYAKEQISIGSLVQSNRIGIYVEDDGDGVPEGKLLSIFTRFEKGKDGQTGLGLAVVKRIMDQHDGEVVAENLSSGFRITLWFPRIK